MADIIEARGWGHIEVDLVHPGVGVVRTHAAQDTFPVAFFRSTLSGCLSEVAGEPVAVQAIGTASVQAGDPTPSEAYAFGAPATIARLTSELSRSDGNLEEALARI